MGKKKEKSVPQDPTEPPERQGPEHPSTGFADAFTEYAKPLLDSTDGSMEQVQTALSIAQLCWNLALIDHPDAEEQTIQKMKAILPYDEDEFEQFRQDIIEMMLDRHRRMFPGLHPRKGE